MDKIQFASTSPDPTEQETINDIRWARACGKTSMNIAKLGVDDEGRASIYAHLSDYFLSGCYDKDYYGPSILEALRLVAGAHTDAEKATLHSALDDQLAAMLPVDPISDIDMLPIKNAMLLSIWRDAAELLPYDDVYNLYVSDEDPVGRSSLASPVAEAAGLARLYRLRAESLAGGVQAPETSAESPAEESYKDWCDWLAHRLPLTFERGELHFRVLLRVSDRLAAAMPDACSTGSTSRQARAAAVMADIFSAAANIRLRHQRIEERQAIARHKTFLTMQDVFQGIPKWLAERSAP